MIESFFYIGIILLIIGIVGYFLGAKGIAGISAELGKFLLVVGVILGIILILINTFAGE
jgi:hypothetical protein